MIEVQNSTNQPKKKKIEERQYSQSVSVLLFQFQLIRIARRDAKKIRSFRKQAPTGLDNCKKNAGSPPKTK